MSDRLTPFGVIDRYFYSGDEGRPVLGWGSFHAQRILELLVAEGYVTVNADDVRAVLRDGPDWTDEYGATTRLADTVNAAVSGRIR